MNKRKFSFGLYLLLGILSIAFIIPLNNTPNIKPLSSAHIKGTSEYGMRNHPITHKTKLHTGVDFIAELGTPAMATADGVVLNIIHHTTGYGNHIIIEHLNSIKTIYAQLDQVLVTVGQPISQKDIIGTVGSSGASTGPHLHYEIELHGQKVDPSNYYSN